MDQTVAPMGWQSLVGSNLQMAQDLAVEGEDPDVEVRRSSSLSMTHTP